jgi:hypothetical protein
LIHDHAVPLISFTGSTLLKVLFTLPFNDLKELLYLTVINFLVLLLKAMKSVRHLLQAVDVQTDGVVLQLIEVTVLRLGADDTTHHLKT